MWIILNIVAFIFAYPRDRKIADLITDGLELACQTQTILRATKGPKIPQRATFHKIQWLEMFF